MGRSLEEEAQGVSACGMATGDSSLAQAVTACGKLAEASAAMLIRVETTSALTIIASSGLSSGIYVDSPAIRATTEREAALMFPTSEANWVDAENGGEGATVFVRIAGAGVTPHLFLLDFLVACTVTRVRVARLIPTLITLITAQVAAAARITMLEERQSIYSLALDHSACGVIAVRDDHSIVFANAPAMTMLADNDGLHVKRGIVRPVDYKQAVRFETALDMVQQQPAEHGADNQPALVMLLPSQRHARPLIVALVPVRHEAEGGQNAAALIYLFQGVTSAHGLDTIAELHGLTGVERRLLAQLCAGLTVAESAARLRIKLETARAYLKQIFLKTGTHRQVELVALMTRYLGVVRGDFDFKPA